VFYWRNTTCFGPYWPSSGVVLYVTLNILVCHKVTQHIFVICVANNKTDKLVKIIKTNKHLKLVKSLHFCIPGTLKMYDNIGLVFMSVFILNHLLTFAFRKLRRMLIFCKATSVEVRPAETVLYVDTCVPKYGIMRPVHCCFCQCTAVFTVWWVEAALVLPCRVTAVCTN
jgi:hypothetical protein